MGNSQSSNSELSNSAQRRNSNPRTRSRSGSRHSSRASTPRQAPLTENISPLLRERSPQSNDVSNQSSPIISGAKMVPVRYNHIGRNSSLAESPFVGSPLIQPDDLLVDVVAPRLASMSTSPPSSQKNKQPSRVSGSSNEDSQYSGRRPISFSVPSASLHNCPDNNNLPQPDTFPSSLPNSSQPYDMGDASYSNKGKPNYVNPLADAEGGMPTLITWNSSAHNVYITGTFNGWKHKIPLNKSLNEFSTVLNFPPGIHHIKFIVDDEWKCSNDLLTATDQDGNLVNYIEVDGSSSPIYDSITQQSDICSTSPPGEYTKSVPDFNLISSPPRHRRGSTASTSSEVSSRPPLLPPHLEKVLLNSVPIHSEGLGKGTEDSWLLPVPNHVVLNHLYACSIRDGVMAVAGTSRYRNKYVTTIFYKPVVI